MSAPIRNDDGIEDPVSYAPRWARQPASAAPEIPALANVLAMAAAIANSPPVSPGESDAPATTPGNSAVPAMAPGIGGPNIGLPRSAGRPFEGDVAVKDLRRRLSLDPDVVPQPPRKAPRPISWSWIGRLAFILIVAASVAFIVTVMTLPQEIRKEASGVAGVLAPLVDGWSRMGSAPPPARLVVENQRAAANEPIALGVSLQNASGGEIVTVSGLAAGAKLSAGTPLGVTGWQMPARDLGTAVVLAPADFVGVMTVAVDLRSTRDRILDSQIVRLEWAAKKERPPAFRSDQPGPAPAVQPLDSEEMTALVRRGEEFFKNGDIATARLFLRRAANAGNGQAALALGATFDPLVLAEQSVVGPTPDVRQARAWYERAKELGSSEASRRLERLASPGK